MGLPKLYPSRKLPYSGGATLSKEATARIKINKLLEASGWRFFADGSKPANIQLESGVKIKPTDLEGMGEDFEKTKRGFLDFLLGSFGLQRIFFS